MTPAILRFDMLRIIQGNTPSAVKLVHHHGERLALIAILLLALVLRLGWPGLTEFKADEARLLQRALQMATLESFPLRGIANSVGLPNFPAAVWLYALPLALWRHPYAPTLFTGLLNVLAVAATWYLARRIWGPRVALAAALLFAVNPWAIVHSRKIWAQNLLPPLITLWGLSAVLAFVKKRPWFLTLHLFLLVLAVQVHLAAIALAPATALYVLRFRRRLQWRPLLAGLALGLLSLLPFAVYLSRQSGLLSQFTAQLSGGNGPDAAGGATFLNPWRFLYFLSSGSDIHSLAGPAQFQTYLQQLPPMWPVYALLVGLMLAGFLTLLNHLRAASPSGPRAETAFILIVWLLAPPLFFTIVNVSDALHYLLPVYPVPFILAALGLQRLEQRAAPFLSIALLIVAALQLYAWLTLFSLVSTQATPGGFGPPLAQHLQAAATVRNLAQQHNGAVFIAGEGEDPRLSEFAAIYDYLLDDTPHRFVDATRHALFPAEPTVALLDASLTPAHSALYRSAAAEQTTVPLRTGEGALSVLLLPASAAPPPDTDLAKSANMANYAKIFGYDVSSESGALEWRLHWQTADSPVPQDYHFFNHLLDANGQRIAQADGPVFDPAQWRQGDIVISAFILSLPGDAQGPFTMRSGMYHYPGGENVPLIDVAGNPASDALEVTIE